MAAGWTVAAVPTQIDIERSGGFMVYGAFGNPGGCAIGDQFYVKSDHTQYKEIYAAALAAFTAGYKLRAYIHSCEAVTWYTVAPNAYNIVHLYTAVTILK